MIFKTKAVTLATIAPRAAPRRRAAEEAAARAQAAFVAFLRTLARLETAARRAGEGAR